MDENWKNLEDAEDFACFRAELVEMSSESYSLEEKKEADSRRHVEDVLRH